MIDLPSGWRWTTIGEVTERVPSVNPESYPSRQFRYLDISSVDNRDFKISGVKTFNGADAPSRARRPVAVGDVIFSNVRTYLRNIALVGDPSPADLCSTGFTVLRPGEAIVAGYLFRYVLTDAFIEGVTPSRPELITPLSLTRLFWANKSLLDRSPSKNELSLRWTPC